MSSETIFSPKTAWLVIVVFILTACQSNAAASRFQAPEQVSSQPESSTQLDVPQSTERPIYEPGELVEYIAQAGDTLPALAIRFNTSVEEIREANPSIPETATTMPPGMPMQIPIYYLPLWGSSYRIIPDSQFINGPSMTEFDTRGFLAAQPGWISSYSEYAAGANRTTAEIVDIVALKFSVSPKILLALMEYQTGALSNPEPTEDARTYPLGYNARDRKGLYRQLIWTANLLNNGYYPWRAGALTSIERQDGQLMRFDPWLNAASVSLQNYFNTLLTGNELDLAISSEGFGKTYTQVFGDPWQDEAPHIPASLEQPPLSLPFEPGSTWAYTGGPHTGWGVGEPSAALDFAPPAVASGCIPTNEWTTAIADGVIVRSETGEIVLDLDGDGDERTGWNIFYLHIATENRTPIGTIVQNGDPLGYPSCEGGTSTGTHIHIARKYNGEWIAADGVLAFNLEGWVAHNGDAPYQGTLTRLSQTVTACVCSNQGSFIQAAER